ncbi:hypothetical protein AB0K02_23380 [Streptomyces sp. NPDC049597]|uniref:hypothetical protein n=1 Tax=Streptomyces sp. NPDC049597 TaxID=3155276 RepID=UPI00341BC1B4
MPNPQNPMFTQVQLVGPAEAVDRLMGALSGVSEVIFDARSEPDARGDVTGVARVVTHAGVQDLAGAGTVAVTVQSVLEVEGGAAARRRQVEESVRAALGSLPGVRQASSRVVAAVPLPSPRE